MTKLKKTKSYHASEETLSVRFKDQIREVANLLKLGIVNQSIILVDIDNVWQEINVVDIGGDNSDLASFKIHVENHNLSLVDLGLIKEEKPNYDVKYTDFEELAVEFPDYNYVQIGTLHEFENAKSNQSCVYSLRQILRMLTNKKMSINDYILDSETFKKENISNFEVAGTIKTIKNDFIDDRIKQLESNGMALGSNGYIGYGFQVTTDDIFNISDNNWNAFINNLIEAKNQPKTEVLNNFKPSIEPKKNPVSLETIGALSEDRIKELLGLKESQQKIVDENPIIEITDKKTYELAKTTAANLLKASTAIDGDKGLEANANKYLNQFKSMLKNAFAPLSEMTRKPYNTQKEKIKAWENAETLRLQAEETAKLQKIKERTDRMFLVPFSFNGELYSIGTFFVLPSQIENSTDEDFDIIIDQGEKYKKAIDTTESAKDAQIKKMTELLKAQGFEMNSNGEMVPIPVRGVPGAENLEVIENIGSVLEEMVDEIITPILIPVIHDKESVNIKTPTPSRFKPGTDYELPAPNNTILNSFDLAHTDIISIIPINPAFIKCREYFKHGTKEVANEIIAILEDSNNAVKKSERISNLCQIIKNS